MDLTTKILIVDDNKEILESLKLFMGRYFENIFTEKNPSNLHHTISKNKIDIILLDMNFSRGKQTGNEGLFWLKEIVTAYSDVVVILITAYGDVDLAVEGMKNGAFDFILKPWDNKKFLSSVKAASAFVKSKKKVNQLNRKNQSLLSERKQKLNFVHLPSQAMQEIFSMLDKVAPTDASILILGENGVGKDVIASLIHEKSQQKDEIFLSVDLTALSETLFESELFGAEKGSYTGANITKIGKFEAAEGGTLFLDEIGNLPVHLQAKVLTVLQNRKIYRLGSSSPIEVDFRLITATNKNLKELIDKELFREDLLYRINTVQIEIPPLRDRTEDIVPLAQEFLSKYAKKYSKGNLRFTKSAIQKLEKYSWPGNVRELKHTIEKAVILSDNELITDASYDLNYNKMYNTELEILNLKELEKKTIQKAISKSNGNMSNAAKLLGISRNTLYAKLEKYGL